MAMLASKTAYTPSLGTTSSQTSSAGQYTSSIPNHRTPVITNPQSGPFASPTESEFSEAYDGPDTVRYVIFLETDIIRQHNPVQSKIVHLRLIDLVGLGTRGALENGCEALVAPNTNSSSNVSSSMDPPISSFIYASLYSPPLFAIDPVLL